MRIDPGRIVIYDALGRQLQTLSGGGETTVWNGRDHRGRPVPPGVYWVEAVAFPVGRLVRLP